MSKWKPTSFQSLLWALYTSVVTAPELRSAHATAGESSQSSMGYRTVSFFDTRAHVQFRFRSLEVFERDHLDECTRAILSLAAVEFQPPFIDVATIRQKLYKYICPL